MGFTPVINGMTIDELLDFHRATFGGARMEADGDGDGGDGTSTSDGNTGGDTSTATDAFKPITSQADLDALIANRLGRERSKFADYDDLKAKATRLDEIDAANKSELERANEARDAEKQRADSAAADLIRERVARKYGITDDTDVELLGTGTAEEIEARAKRLAELRNAAGAKPPGASPHQGRDAAKPNPSVAAGKDLYAERRGRSTTTNT